MIEGDQIGVAADGVTSLPNGDPGVLIASGAANNSVGGTTAAAANVISDNTTYGIQIDGTGTSGNQVLGNDIGLNAAGVPIVGEPARGLALPAARQTTRSAGRLLPLPTSFPVTVATGSTLWAQRTPSTRFRAQRLPAI